MGIIMMAALPGMWARGAEICTLNLLTGLHNMGVTDLYFHAALRQAIPAEREMYLLPRYQEVATVTWGIHGANDGLSERLSRRLAEVKPDILLYAFDKSIPVHAPNTKSVLVVHGIAENDFSGYHPEYTDAVVCVSQYAADLAPDYGIPEEKIWTIPNGVPKAEGENRRADYGIPEEAWVWCFVGGLSRLKRPNLLIASMHRRCYDDEYALFAGVSDGGMRLDEYADALGVADRCIFLGHVDNIGDVYNSSDCLVITSERESMPLTMLEAMSVGVGVVGNRVGGIPEVLQDNEECAVLFNDASGEAGLDNALNVIRLRALPNLPAFAIDYWQRHHTATIMTIRYHELFQWLLTR